MGFQRLSFPPSPPAPATHISLACCSVISCSQVKFLPDWNWFQVLPSLSRCEQASGNLVSALQCRMNQMLHLWMAAAPLAPNASGKAPSGGQVLMHQCHMAHMSPYAMEQAQRRRTVWYHCEHSKASSSSHSMLGLSQQLHTCSMQSPSSCLLSCNQKTGIWTSWTVGEDVAFS